MKQNKALERWETTFNLNGLMDTIHQGKEFTAEQCDAIVMIFGLDPDQANYLLFGDPLTITEDLAKDLGKSNFNLLAAYYGFRKREGREPNELELLIEDRIRWNNAMMILSRKPELNLSI